MDKLNTLIHLYETAHSGFYGDNPSETVNLVPKTWTRYTVTDGNWMSPKTVEPLVLRDIYLANKIDEVDEYLGDFYKEGYHILIDKETNTISLNPFEYNYIFTNGILSNNNYIYTDLPNKGGQDNRMYLTNIGLAYSSTPGISSTSADEYGDIERISADNINLSSAVNIVLVTSAEYILDETYSDSGMWISGYTELYDREQGKKVRKEYHGERPEPITADNHTTAENVFDPSDKTLYSPGELTGGKNYIYEDAGGGSAGRRRKWSMVTDGVLYIYDKD